MIGKTFGKSVALPSISFGVDVFSITEKAQTHEWQLGGKEGISGEGDLTVLGISCISDINR